MAYWTLMAQIGKTAEIELVCGKRSEGRVEWQRTLKEKRKTIENQVSKEQGLNISTNISKGLLM